jgi:hypothetical protein
MRRLNRALSAAIMGAMLASSLPRVAHAEDKAAALDLFNAAKKDMDAKNYVEACRKLELAHNYDKSLDGIVLNLATCYQRQGKWASAWGRFRDSLVRAEKSGNEARIAAAKAGIADTEPRISRVTLKVAAKVPGLELRRDDKVVDPNEIGIAVPIDPGEHTFSASAPGYKAWATKFTIAVTAESRTIEVPPLEAEPKAGAKDASGGDTTTSSSSPLVGYAAVGAGVLLVGAGVGAHFIARSAYDDYKAGCAEQTTPTCEDEAGKSKVQTWQTVSFVAGGVGLVAAGVGVVLLVTNKREPRSGSASFVASPTIGSTGAGFSVSGTF